MTRRFKTARCILYREDRYLLAVHSSFWGKRRRRWGLPGGRIEWGESARGAAIRELDEELNVQPVKVTEVGVYHYKNALHMVYAAAHGDDIGAYDSMELLDIGWFTEAEVAGLKARGELHADYELEAIRALGEILDGRR